MSECGCWRCREESGATLNVFIVCTDCGNKRCPKANDHRNACTGSNDVGQPGSAYELWLWRCDGSEVLRPGPDR